MTSAERVALLDRAVAGDESAREQIKHILDECSDELMRDDVFFGALVDYLKHMCKLRKPS
jgi:hypothetical protein